MSDSCEDATKQRAEAFKKDLIDFTDALAKRYGCAQVIRPSFPELASYERALEPDRAVPEIMVRATLSTPFEVTVSLDYGFTSATLVFDDRYHDGSHEGYYVLQGTRARGYYGGMPLLEKLCQMWEDGH